MTRRSSIVAIQRLYVPTAGGGPPTARVPPHAGAARVGSA